MNFRSIKDIKLLDAFKKYDLPTTQLHKHLDYRLDLNTLKQTLGGKPLRGYQVGSDDKHFLSKQFALAKQAINSGHLRKALELLDDLKNEGYRHSDLSYMLGEVFRRLSSFR